MIVLSKAVDIEREHLIHRKRSPFPYEGKALTPDKMGETANVGRTCLTAGERSYSRAPAGRSPSPECGVGWRGVPLRMNYGADSGFRRTLCLHPRRAQRRA